MQAAKSTVPTRTRRFARYAVNAQADVAGQDLLLYHRIRDLSLGGIGLEAPPVGEVGSRVEVTLTFPDLGAEMSLRGEVAWRNHGPPSDVGIRWVDLDTGERDLLARYLAHATISERAPADRP
jgi:hypothetical protein